MYTILVNKLQIKNRLYNIDFLYRLLKNNMLPVTKNHYFHEVLFLTHIPKSNS